MAFTNHERVGKAMGLMQGLDWCIDREFESCPAVNVGRAPRMNEMDSA
jgi:hypothetical protein